MIIVLPDSFSFSKTDIISSVVLLSSAPVGSSASITDGSLTYSTGNSRTLFLSARQLVTVLVCLLFYSDQFKRSLCCFSFIFGLVFCKIKREQYPLLPVRWQRVFCLGRGIVGRIRWKRRCRLSGHRLITCKPHRALGSLLSVALSSMWVKHLHFMKASFFAFISFKMTSSTFVVPPFDYSISINVAGFKYAKNPELYSPRFCRKHR